MDNETTRHLTQTHALTFLIFLSYEHFFHTFFSLAIFLSRNPGDQQSQSTTALTPLLVILSTPSLFNSTPSISLHPFFILPVFYLQFTSTVYQSPPTSTISPPPSFCRCAVSPQSVSTFAPPLLIYLVRCCYDWFFFLIW